MDILHGTSSSLEVPRICG